MRRLAAAAVPAVLLSLAWSSGVAADAAAGPKRFDVPASACVSRGDSAPAIERFLSTVPNGSVVTFPADATCAVARTLDLGVPPAGETNRTDVTYDLRDATITRTEEPSCRKLDECNGPVVALNLVQGVTVQDGSVRGGLRVDGLPSFDATREHDHGIAVHGSSDVTLFGLHVSEVAGDCVDVDKQKKATASNVRVIGTPGAPFTCEVTGRQGVSANAVKELRIQGVTFDRIASSAVDLEPRHNGFIDTALVSGNRFGWVGNYAIAGIGGGETWKDIRVADNVQTDPAHPGLAFLRAGNSFDRGPLVVTGNRIRSRIQLNHTAGRAGGNELIAGPDAPRCMFELFNDPPFEVSPTNRHPSGTRLACALEGKIAAGGVKKAARTLLKYLVPALVVLSLLIAGAVLLIRRRRAPGGSGT